MVISLKLCELEVIQVIEQVWLTSPAGWSTWISPGDRSHGIWSSCESAYEMSSWNNPLTNQWKTGPGIFGDNRSHPPQPTNMRKPAGYLFFNLENKKINI